MFYLVVPLFVVEHTLNLMNDDYLMMIFVNWFYFWEVNFLLVSHTQNTKWKFIFETKRKKNQNHKSKKKILKFFWKRSNTGHTDINRNSRTLFLQNIRKERIWITSSLIMFESNRNKLKWKFCRWWWWSILLVFFVFRKKKYWIFSVCVCDKQPPLIKDSSKQKFLFLVLNVNCGLVFFHRHHRWWWRRPDAPKFFSFFLRF